MKKDFNSQMLVQTVLEVDMELNSLTNRLSASATVELGDDPRLINQVETDLRKINLQIRSLGSHFDLSSVPLSKANYYFTARYNVDDVLRFVQQIREKSYGSIQNTRRVLEKLDECLDSVRRIGLITDYHSDMIQ